MEQIYAQWRVRSNVLGKRFVHLILNHKDPMEAYADLLNVGASTGLDRHALRFEARTYQASPMDRLQFHALVGNGGFTYHPSGLYTPKRGYSTSVHPDHGGVSHVVHLSDLSPDHLAEHRHAAADLFENGHHGHPVHQGAWLDRSTGNTYLDTSHVTPHEHQARDLGIHHRQLAYYALHRGEETYFDPQRDARTRGTPDERHAAQTEYSRVHQKFGQVTPDKYWGFHHEYGPVPGDEEARQHAAALEVTRRRKLMQYGT